MGQVGEKVVLAPLSRNSHLPCVTTGVRGDCSFRESLWLFKQNPSTFSHHPMHAPSLSPAGSQWEQGPSLAVFLRTQLRFGASHR